LCILLYSLGDAAATGFQCLKSRQMPYVCTIFDHIAEFRLFWGRWLDHIVPIVLADNRVESSCCAVGVKGRVGAGRCRFARYVQAVPNAFAGRERARE
jgi:hypothetical protein